MTKFTFNTIGLFTIDNKTMVEFYTDIMGFTTDWDGEARNVMMHHGEMTLMLYPRILFEKMTDQEFSYPKGLNGTVELAFHLPTFSDVDAEYDRAVSLGARSVFSPQTMPWGQRTCYIADPEGNLIEIHSFTED